MLGPENLLVVHIFVFRLDWLVVGAPEFPFAELTLPPPAIDLSSNRVEPDAPHYARALR